MNLTDMYVFRHCANNVIFPRYILPDSVGLTSWFPLYLGKGGVALLLRCPTLLATALYATKGVGDDMLPLRPTRDANSISCCALAIWVRLCIVLHRAIKPSADNSRNTNIPLSEEDVLRVDATASFIAESCALAWY